MILCLIFSIASVSASDLNNTDQVIGASSQEDTLSVPVGDVNNTNALSVSNEDVLSAGVGSGNDNVLGADNVGTYSDLAQLIKLSKDELVLYSDYKYDAATDSEYLKGIPITKSLTIDGNNYMIDGNNLAEVFDIEANNVIVKNLNVNHALVNTALSGAINWKGDNGKLINCNFTNSRNNAASASVTAAGVFWQGKDGLISESRFQSNSMTAYEYDQSAGVTSTADNLTIMKSKFLSLSGSAIAVIASSNNNKIINCTFNNVVGYYTVGVRRAGITVDGCNFTSCSGATGKNKGHEAAVLFARGALTVKNSYFEANSVHNYVVNGAYTMDNCTFKSNNPASSVLAPYSASELSGSSVYNCKFIGETKTVINLNFVTTGNSVSYCLFENCTNRAIQGTNSILTTVDHCTFRNFDMTPAISMILFGNGANRTTITNCVFDNINLKNSYTVCYIDSNVYSNHYNNTLTNCRNADGAITEVTDLCNKNFDLYPVLYVSPTGTGIGDTPGDRTNLGDALSKIAYRGTIYLEPGIYDFTGRKSSYASIIGEKRGEVIINQGAFYLTDYFTSLVNLSFNNSDNAIYLIAHQSIINCSIDNYNHPTSILFYGSNGAQCRNMTLCNITVNNSSFSYFFYYAYAHMPLVTIEHVVIDNSTFSYFTQANMHILCSYKDITISNSTFTRVFNFNNHDNNMYGLYFNNNIVDGVYLYNDTIKECIWVDRDYNTAYDNVVKNVYVINCTADNGAYALFYLRYNDELSNVYIENLDNTRSTSTSDGIVCIARYGNSINGISFINITQDMDYLIRSTNNYDYDLDNVTIGLVNVNEAFNGYNSENKKLRVNISNSNFTNNVTFVLKDKSTLYDSSIVNFTGHVIVNGSSVQILNSKFVNGNNTGLNGTALEVLADGDYLTIKNCDFINNTALYGGAIYVHDGVVRPTFNYDNFTGNIAVGPELDPTYTYGMNNSMGGAIKFEHVPGNSYTITIDDFTNGTTNHTSRWFNNICGNVTSLFGGPVYVVSHPDTWYGDDGIASTGTAMSWENAGTFDTVLLVMVVFSSL